MKMKWLAEYLQELDDQVEAWVMDDYHQGFDVMSRRAYWRAALRQDWKQRLCGWRGHEMIAVASPAGWQECRRCGLVKTGGEGR